MRRAGAQPRRLTLAETRNGFTRLGDLCLTRFVVEIFASPGVGGARDWSACFEVAQSCTRVGAVGGIDVGFYLIYRAFFGFFGNVGFAFIKILGAIL